MFKTMVINTQNPNYFATLSRGYVCLVYLCGGNPMGWLLPDNVILASRNWPQWEYLHHENWQIYKAELFFLPLSPTEELVVKHLLVYHKISKKWKCQFIYNRAKRKAKCFGLSELSWRSFWLPLAWFALSVTDVEEEEEEPGYVCSWRQACYRLPGRTCELTFKME